MTDEELIARLRKADEYEPLGHDGWEAADRIEALVRSLENTQADFAEQLGKATAYELRMIDAEARAERLEAALRKIAAEASVTVHTWKNGINFKKMYEGWRKIATERIDIARAALKGADHDG